MRARQLNKSPYDIHVLLRETDTCKFSVQVIKVNQEKFGNGSFRDMLRKRNKGVSGGVVFKFLIAYISETVGDIELEFYIQTLLNMYIIFIY